MASSALQLLRAFGRRQPPTTLRLRMRQPPPGPARAQIYRRQQQQFRDSSTKNTPAKEPPKTTKKKEPLTDDPIPVPNTVPPVPLWWQRLGPLTRAAGWYGRAQRRRPYLTQLCTSLVIYLCADISAQRMNGKDEYDPVRTARSLVIGGVASIPGYKWFMFLSHNFNYPSRLLSLAVKIAINQSFFTPAFNTYFFGMQSLLSGDSLEQVAERIRRTVPVSIVNSLKLWPAVTAFSFTFVPPEYRSVFAGVVAVGWQTYLAFLNRQAELLAAEKAASGAAAATAAAATVTAGSV